MDYGWIKEYEHRKLEMYSDICAQDKAFFKLWNEFIYDINATKALLNKEMLSTCLGFLQKNIDELKGMRDNLLMHLLTMNEYRLLTASNIHEIMARYDALQEETRTLVP